MSNVGKNLIEVFKCQKYTNPTKKSSKNTICNCYIGPTFLKPFRTFSKILVSKVGQFKHRSSILLNHHWNFLLLSMHFPKNSQFFKVAVKIHQKHVCEKSELSIFFYKFFACTYFCNIQKFPAPFANVEKLLDCT